MTIGCFGAGAPAGYSPLWRRLSCRSRAGKARFREAALFTHRGLSGPAILQASSYWRHGESVAIDFLPDAPVGWLKEKKRRDPRSHLRSAVASGIPDRLALALLDELGLAGDLGTLPDRMLDVVQARLPH